MFELDSKLKSGIISETDTHDDYFTYDNLEAEREIIKKSLEQL